jgi:hypothetical protein
MSRPVSQWSAVNIGLQKPSYESDSVKAQFREEAQAVTKYLKGVHHSQKQSHAQVNYSETVTKLSKLAKDSIPYVKEPRPPKIHSSSHAMVVSRQNETIESMKKNAFLEHDLNSRKRAYNRQVGRVAIVNSVSKRINLQSHRVNPTVLDVQNKTVTFF